MTSAESIGEAWRRASLRIERLDARLLLTHVCACSHADLIASPERLLSAAQGQRLEQLLARREAGEPLAYLLGSAFFYDLEFEVSPAVLIPRDDTRVLVEQGKAWVQRREQQPAQAAPRIVDLGTGSGIVAIMLARLCPTAMLTAVDLSPDALAVAQRNAQRHAACIRFVQGDWWAPLGDERFDLIVSNPPYVVAQDPHLQLNGLPFEPSLALTDGVAGGDGLACIRTIIDGAPGHLLPQGGVLIEHGYDQAVQVRDLLSAAGFSGVASWPDDAGIERVSGGFLP
jgi:release factor glutamine methyltransferase